MEGGGDGPGRAGTHPCPACAGEASESGARCGRCGRNKRQLREGGDPASTQRIEGELVGMGFNRWRVKQALRTVGSGLERALSWLLDGSIAPVDEAGEAYPGREEGSERAQKVARVGGRSCTPTPPAVAASSSASSANEAGPSNLINLITPPASPSSKCTRCRCARRSARRCRRHAPRPARQVRARRTPTPNLSRIRATPIVPRRCSRRCLQAPTWPHVSCRHATRAAAPRRPWGTGRGPGPWPESPPAPSRPPRASLPAHAPRASGPAKPGAAAAAPSALHSTCSQHPRAAAVRARLRGVPPVRRPRRLPRHPVHVGSLLHPSLARPSAVPSVDVGQAVASQGRRRRGSGQRAVRRRGGRGAGDAAGGAAATRARGLRARRLRHPPRRRAAGGVPSLPVAGAPPALPPSSRSRACAPPTRPRRPVAQPSRSSRRRAAG